MVDWKWLLRDRKSPMNTEGIMLDQRVGLMMPDRYLGSE